MPLLDHFRPPLSERRNRHSFQNSWATYLSSHLNTLLPEGYFAGANVQFGVEIDVAAFETTGLAASPDIWTPPPPNSSSLIELPEAVVEVGIFSRTSGPSLAGAIELVSSANKDRPAHREAFVSKCAAYLQAGVGLVLVDVVTERSADLHLELLERVGVRDAAAASSLFGTAYRSVERDGSTMLDSWFESLAIGEKLPMLPLWLRGGLCLPVDLEATYVRTCVEQRIQPAA